MVKKYIVFFILWSFSFAFAQETIFRGVVIDSKTQNPLENVVVSIQNSSITKLTSKSGKFELHSSIEGEQLLLIHSQDCKDLLLKIHSNFGQIIYLGVLQLEDIYSDEVPAALRIILS